MLELEDRLIPFTDDLERVRSHISTWDDTDNSPVIVYRLEDMARSIFRLENLLHVDESDNFSTRRLTVEELGRITPELLNLYEETYRLGVEKSDRLHTTRDLGAHIDAFAGSLQIHINLTLSDRALRVVNSERHMLGRALHSGEETIEKAVSKLFLKAPIYGGVVSYGDLTFMKDCLHHFDMPDEKDQVINAVRLSQHFKMPEDLLTRC